ncbi:MAG TPA: V-type ATP synthase subunit E [Candidatus Micrarchaeota archaeon]|nr:V-type ATP synthase subunit E [Candidatus Micrarchaeota archaeon]
MGLEELREEIIQKVRSQARKTLEDADRQADSIIISAKKSSEEQVKQAYEHGGQVAQDESAERIAAKLEAKKVQSEGMEYAIGVAMEDVWREVLSLKKSKDYPKLLRKLVTDGIKELGEANPTVYVTSEDKKHLAGVKANVSTSRQGFSGGAIIESQSGLVRVDNSLESIFAGKRDIIRKEIYKELFA